MNKSQLISFYEKRISHLRILLKSKKKVINTISNIRIAVALVFIGTLYLGYVNSYFFLGSALTAVFFAFLVKRHGHLFEEKNHVENLVTINEWEVQGLQGDNSCFANGSEFMDPHHPYTYDLDIFGDGSLFQSLNRCNTMHGRRAMAHQLSAPLNSAEDIKHHQDAIQELSEKTDFRQHFQAAGLEIREEKADRDQLLQWLLVPSFLYGKAVFRILLPLFPVVTVLFVIAAFFVSAAKPLAILLAFSQWALLAFYLKRVNAFHEFIAHKKTILQKYAHILHYLQGEKFVSRSMQIISSSAMEADKKINALASLVRAFNARLNAMTNLVVNSLIMYDLQCVYRLEKWKHENAGGLKIWLDVVSQAEVLGSMGTFRFNHPEFRFATIDTHQSPAIEAKGLGHPLIPVGERVTNDMVLSDNPSVVIITGANMAGKSTFLRAIGVNLVLALSGSVVCAETFRCPIISIRSGMRTADSLKDHESYFYAELNRLKAIMDELRTDKPLFILLDEILKGTNSNDKQLGSIALVKQLLQHPCLALIATHDLALGELEKEFPLRLRNFCFEASIENDQLSFDYKLKPGLAQTMNATYLMKKMGIIPG